MQSKTFELQLEGIKYLLRLDKMIEIEASNKEDDWKASFDEKNYKEFFEKMSFEQLASVLEEIFKKSASAKFTSDGKLKKQEIVCTDQMISKFFGEIKIELPIVVKESPFAVLKKITKMIENGDSMTTQLDSIKKSMGELLIFIEKSESEKLDLQNRVKILENLVLGKHKTNRYRKIKFGSQGIWSSHFKDKITSKELKITLSSSKANSNFIDLTNPNNKKAIESDYSAKGEQWMQLDFSTIQINPFSYFICHEGDDDAKMIDWKLQGKKSNGDWITIHEQTNFNGFEKDKNHLFYCGEKEDYLILSNFHSPNQKKIVASIFSCWISLGSIR